MSQIKNTLILTLSAIISGILNYMTYPILIRYLSIADYAEFSVYMSLIPILSIPVSGFAYKMLIEFRRSRESYSKFGSADILKLFYYTLAYISSVTLVSLLIYYIFGLTSWSALCIVIVAFIPSVYSAYFMSLFQALGYFSLLAGITVFMAIVRFGLSLGTISYPTVGMATLAIVFPGLLISGFAYWYGRRIIGQSVQNVGESKVSLSEGNSVYAYILITGIIVLIQNIDVLIVKSFSDDLGVTLYASVAVIVKFSLILIAIIDTVVAPVLVDTEKKSDHKKYFLNLTILSLFGYVVSLTLLPWLGEKVLYLLKDELLASWTLWASLGVAMVSLGFFSLFIKVYMSWGQKDILYVGFIGSFLLFGLYLDTLESFSVFFASVLTFLYAITLYKIWYYISEGKDEVNI